MPAATPPASVVAPDLQVGVCLDADGPDARAVPVACHRPHFWEVFALIPYPAGESDVYAGDAWLYTFGADECLPYFEAYTGDVAGSSGLAVTALVPDAAQWAAGEREIVCELYKPTGSSPLREEIRGSRRQLSGWFDRQSPTSSPIPAYRASDRLIGKWTATNAVTGALFLLQFRRDGAIRLLHYGAVRDGAGGEYAWINDDAIRLTFLGSSYAGQDADFCARVPSFLEGFCQTRIVDPASYPGPEQ